MLRVKLNSIYSLKDLQNWNFETTELDKHLVNIKSYSPEWMILKIITLSLYINFK